MIGKSHAAKCRAASSPVCGQHCSCRWSCHSEYKCVAASGTCWWAGGCSNPCDLRFSVPANLFLTNPLTLQLVVRLFTAKPTRDFGTADSIDRSSKRITASVLYHIKQVYKISVKYEIGGDIFCITAFLWSMAWEPGSSHGAHFQRMGLLGSSRNITYSVTFTTSGISPTLFLWHTTVFVAFRLFLCIFHLL